ncbi:response regulator [Bacillus wiedmannii]|uniref:response regulator n=1 Tax=Bacillus wiedmannii TaxID=1890302 RepID=UPI000B44DB76|nr:hypothetical protein BK740_06195 [Bacillus thuringiensis serovar argentinensis]
MGLKYKILWFEDDPDLVEYYSTDIKKFLNEYGFIVEIVHEENGERLETLLKDEYDLILTDLNLGEDDSGDQIISRIREHSILTEVLFYSGNEAGINEVLSKHRWVERVSFIVGIENLIDKIKQLISLTIRKLQEVNAVRGLVIAETSELDGVMIEVINSLFGVILPEQLDSKKQELIDKTMKNRSERLEQLGEQKLEDIEGFYHKLESADRLNAIRRLIKHVHKQLGRKVFDENIEVLKAYEKEILQLRNTLAHAKTIVEDGQKKVISLLSGTEVSFNDEACKVMRKDIRKHQENLASIHQKIKAISS